MRTKPVLIVIGLIALAVAVAWWSRDPVVEPAPATGAEVGTAEPVIEQVEVPDNVLDEQPVTPSPQGLYDDLDDAFERASKKPEIDYQPSDAPQLEPPQRGDDAGDDGDEP